MTESSDDSDRIPNPQAQSPQYYLGIETSGSATGVALIEARGLSRIAGSDAGDCPQGLDRIVFESSVPGTGHNEVLPGLVARALDSAGLAAEQLKGIGVTIGPGMFTALRVGLAFAKGLALPHSIPVKGIDTLLALALTAEEASGPGRRSPDSGPSPLYLALIDARKQQVYCGLYSAGKPLLDPAVLHPGELPAALKDGLPWPGLGHNPDSPGGIGLCPALTLCGSGALLCTEAIEQAGLRVQLSGIGLPEARVVARLGRRLIEEQGGDNIADLAPVYLRRTDAELQREKR